MAIFEVQVFCLVISTTVTIAEDAPEFGVGIGASKGEGIEFGILGLGLGREVDFPTRPSATGEILVARVRIPNPGVHMFPPIGVVKLDGVGVVLS